MKVLVTGAKGQLGQDVVKLLEGQTCEVFGFGREELNITDEKQVNEKYYQFSQMLLFIRRHIRRWIKLKVMKKLLLKLMLKGQSI